MITLKKMITEFSKKLCRRWDSIHTIRRYTEWVEKIFNLCWKIENWQEIRSREIEDLIFGNKKRSQGTKASYAITIRSFLKFCRSRDLNLINPETITVPKIHIKEARYLSLEAENKILKSAEKSDFTLKVALKLMLSTGLRVSEASNLTKENLNKAKFICWLYQIPIQGKGQNTRAIFITEEIYNLCKLRASRHTKQTVLWIKTHEIQRKIKNFSEKLKIKFTAHTLRHTYLTKLAENGVELYKIQKIAGHKCIITTSRYLHTCDLELAQAVGKLHKFAY